MANVPNSMDKFNPGMDKFNPGQGGGGMGPVTIMSKPAMQIGKNFELGSAAPAAPAVGQGSALPSHQQAQIGQSNAPKGAQPVSLMGMAPQGAPILGQQTPKMPLSPGAQQLSMNGRAPAAPALAGPSMDGEIHTIIIEGRGPDNKIYTAEYDAVFPRGTIILGVKDRFGE